VFCQEAVYRCGNVITNDAIQAKQEKCQLLVAGAVVSVPTHSTSQPVPRVPVTPKRIAPVPSAEQRARDQDAKKIIEAELHKTQLQLAELRKSDETTSPQDSERKLALKQQIARAEADIASLKRELAH